VKHISKLTKNPQMPDTSKALSDESGRGEQYTCPVCHDMHFVHPLKEDGKPDYSRVVPCQCVKEQLEKERTQSLLRYCELPPGTEHMTLLNFKVSPQLQEAYDLAVDLANGAGRIKWLTLTSKVNRGKTHLGIAICRHWLQKGKPARYAFVPLLLDELKRGFRGEGDLSYEARFDRFLNVPLLVLDDLGAEYRTPWVQEKLDTIIDYRLMHDLYLVVTTNKPMAELPFRIASRLKRSPGSRIVFIKAPEFRKGKK